MALCFRTVAGGRFIRYNYAAQRVAVPSLATLAGVLDAVPLEDGSPFAPAGGSCAFDAAAAWGGFSAVNVTAFMHDAHVNATSTLAFMDPGYEWGNPLAPTLTGSPDLSLVDFLVAARVFNIYMVDACIPGTAEHALMERIAVVNPWPRPIAVFGYDDTWPLAGDLFEAETTCVSSNNMGQVATAGVPNLSWMRSQAPPITAPLVQSPAPLEPLNASRTYVAFVVGDGDNVAMVRADRHKWMQQRADACSLSGEEARVPRAANDDGLQGGPCFPLAWTISPHLLYLAPGMLRWFYDTAATTRADFFVLPPSGHLYSYPALMHASDAAAFVAATEEDCRLLNSSASVEWEFAGMWPAAVADYVPRYGARGVVRALFAVNVPYLVPAPEFPRGEFYKVVPGAAPGAADTVLFAPNEWRGTSGSADPALHPFLNNATEMAARLGAYPRGTVTAIYVTSDGGAQLSDISALVALLPEHVRVVNPRAIADLALQAHALGGGGV